MKKIFYIISFLFIMIFSIEVKAVCSSEEFKILKEKADKVEFSQEYEIIEYEDYLSPVVKEAIYKITAYNLDSELSVYIAYADSTDSKQIFKYNKNKTTTLKDFYSGRVKITIEGNTKNCSGKLLNTQYMDLLFYNPLSNAEECQTYPEFEYCQSEFTKDYVDNVVFINKLEKYISKLKEEQEVEEEEIEEEVEKFPTNLVIISAVSIVIILLITFILYKFIKKEGEKRSL